ncbi:MAG: alcohol dehydrogenase catalytic domain-containing protein [Chloroflexi bacterium]|nr:alcohol dehydrogenase catalytic domain-containing protein [Chloroflexota bacterium]
MRVGVYYNNQDVRLAELPMPRPGRGELLVKVIASGICGSDVMEWYRIKRAPRVLGHEITGDIVQVGEGVTQYQVGQRVFVSHHVPCNTCRYCLSGNHTVCETLHTTNYDPGGFSEYVRVPALNVDRGVMVLPDGVSYDEGTFIEPLACVVRGQRVARLQPGQAVAVLGSGIAGLLNIALAKALGAGRIIATDVNEYRLAAARRFGADVVFDGREDVPALLREANDGRPVDLVIVCAGAYPVFPQALRSVDRAGTVLFFAPTEPGVDLPVPVNDFWRNGVTLLPTYGAAPSDLAVSLDLIRARRLPLPEMITHRLPMAEIAQGFRLVAEARESIKVIIYPQQ